jgi:hypothetical protein
MDSDHRARRRQSSRAWRGLDGAQRVLIWAAALWCAVVLPARGQAPGAVAVEGCAAMEDFLKTAPIVRQRDLPVGVTVPRRATLDDGRIRHDAAIQDTDVSRAVFETSRSTELNFRDSWKFNVAGYELAKILQLNMVPPYVERDVEGRPASVSWWVNDAMMGRDQYRRKLVPPDTQRWSEEMQAVRVFHQLIHDTDPNLTNLLITKDWRVWMIDFTRAFRWTTRLQNPHLLVRCDRRLLANLRAMPADTLREKLGRWLTKREIDGVLARRDLIVKRFDDQIASRGEAFVLYDLPRTSEPCGAGLQ